MEKEQEEKLNAGKTSSDINLKLCPGCNSEMIWRIQRSETEKMACFLSHGQYAAKKYVCQTCGGNILMHAATIQYIEVPVANAENENMVPFVSCKKCGSHTLQFTRADSKAATSDLGKVSCPDCNDATIIDRQEYAAFASSSF